MSTRLPVPFLLTAMFVCSAFHYSAAHEQRHEFRGTTVKPSVIDEGGINNSTFVDYSKIDYEENCNITGDCNETEDCNITGDCNETEDCNIAGDCNETEDCNITGDCNETEDCNITGDCNETEDCNITGDCNETEDCNITGDCNETEDCNITGDCNETEDCNITGDCNETEDCNITGDCNETEDCNITGDCNGVKSFENFQASDGGFVNSLVSSMLLAVGANVSCERGECPPNKLERRQNSNGVFGFLSITVGALLFLTAGLLLLFSWSWGLGDSADYPISELMMDDVPECIVEDSVVVPIG